MRWTLVCCILVVLSACSAKAPTASGSGSMSGSGPAIGMVTDVGGLGDKSFNDSAFRGLQRAHTDLQARVTVLESKSVTDYEPNLSTLAQQGNALIFAIGFLMHDSLNAVAPRFPKTHFAIIDSVVDQPNVTSITFKEEESSFLAGVLAGLTTKKNRVGFLGGIQSPLIEKFRDGFEAGVKSANPAAQVLVKYTGSFDDVASGKEYTSLLYDQGADIVYAAAGKCGLGAIDEAKNRPNGYYIIGVDSDQDALAPGKVLTSALKHIDNAVFTLASQTVRHMPVGHHLELGLKQDGVGLTAMPFTRALLPAGALATVERYRRAIVRGVLRVPSTPAELKDFHPVAASALR